MKKLITLLAAASLLATGTAQAQQGRNRQPSGNPLSSIFACQNPNNRQGTGAVVGGVVGGVVGNQLAGDDRKDRTIGTVLGAAIGAAAGSDVGCRMGSGDQSRAQTATQTALNTGKPQTWRNERSGATGRIDIVDSYNYGADNNAGPSRVTLESVRWTQGVERPREYQPDGASYRVIGAPVLRAGPSAKTRQLGALRDGERVDGVVRIEGTDWLLAARDGPAIGYVAGASLQETRDARPRGRPRYDPNAGQTCRVFDQTFTPRGGQPENQRFTACQTAQGEWVIQNA